MEGQSAGQTQGEQDRLAAVLLGSLTAQPTKTRMEEIHIDEAIKCFLGQANTKLTLTHAMSLLDKLCTEEEAYALEEEDKDQ